MDVMVLPSLTTKFWKEQFGHVLIEAFACETPVIGSSSAEIPNVIGEAGLIAPEGDAAALRDALARLMGDAGLRAALARRGRERALAHYTNRKIAEADLAFFEEVAGRRG
jgi:glycosyltransferase involved in cell wall biosynthesis